MAEIARMFGSAPLEAGLGPVVTMLERIGPWPSGQLSVLTYHRVDRPDAHPELYPGLLSATPEAFERQLEAIARRHRPVSLADVMRARSGERRLPPGAILVTFDDAYADFGQVAWPILRRLGIPAVLFVPTAYPGRPDLAFWWDRLYDALRHAPEDTTIDLSALPLSNGSAGRSPSTADAPIELSGDGSRRAAFRALREWLKGQRPSQIAPFVERLAEQFGAPPPSSATLSWDDLIRLATDGVSLAPHTRSHALLDRLAADEIAAEVDGAIKDLEREIGSAPLVLAYPSGAHDPTVVSAVAQAGILVGFTTLRGVNRLPLADSSDTGRQEWLQLRRINVGRGAGPNSLRLQVLPLTAPLLPLVERLVSNARRPRSAAPVVRSGTADHSAPSS